MELESWRIHLALIQIFNFQKKIGKLETRNMVYNWQINNFMNIIFEKTRKLHSKYKLSWRKENNGLDGAAD